MRFSGRLVAALLVLLLSACSGPSSRPSSESPLPVSEKGNEVAIYALGLLGIDYRFGGKNPEAGFDCSGMVSYIYEQAAGIKVQGSAADIARLGRPIKRSLLRPGDLVFFNTRNKAFSHVGIYLGDTRFIHAPSTNGQIRINHLSDSYFEQRFEAARTYFE